MNILRRPLVLAPLMFSTISLFGCGQVIREGFREGTIIDSELVCKDCLISTETRLEFVNSEIPNKIRIFNEVTYGDSYRNKYEKVAYQDSVSQPLVRSALGKTLSIPFSAGLILLTPSYYTKPQFDCNKDASSCNYSTESEVVENEYMYLATTSNTYTKKNHSNSPVSVSIFNKTQTANASTIIDNSNTEKKPAKKKAKKAKKSSVKSASEENNAPNAGSYTLYASQSTNPVNGIVEINLCSMLDLSKASTEYLVRYESENKSIESTLRMNEVRNYCSNSALSKAERVFDQLDMAAPPK